MSAGSRLRFVDIVRALSMMLIVGFHHMQDYLAAGYIYDKHLLFGPICGGALAAFAFISGYFLGKKEIHSGADVIDFMKKRLLRVYPMFFISCTTLYLMNLMFGVDIVSGFRQYVLTLTGLATFVGDSPKTIWFISMLLVFYAVTPFLLRIKLRGRIAAVALIYAVLLAGYYLRLPTDPRVVWLWFFYGAGLLYAEFVKLSDRADIYKSMFAVTIFFCGACLYHLSHALIFSYVYIAAGIVVLMEAGRLLERVKNAPELFARISYASMVVYLFHRHYYGVLHRMIGDFSIWAAYLIIIPVFVVMSYGVQYGYDRLMNRVAVSKKKQVA